MNSKLDSAKDKLRKEIAAEKRQYTSEQLLQMSDEVFSVLEITGMFRDASTIFIYNAMADEVSTQAFIEKWKSEKIFYLPVVKDEHLVFRKLENNTSFEKSKIGVDEPIGDDFTNFSKVDLIIVPGTAFDRKCNRLGRGKGYYDRFLTNIKAPKVGVCFDFQLKDQIPADERDIKMDMIVGENELIW